MGQSLSGMLFYGVHFEEDWEEEYLDEDGDLFYRDPDAKRLGIEVGMFGGEGWMQHYLAIKESETRASDAGPAVVTSLAVGDDWEARIREFCTLKGIEHPVEPGWAVTALLF